MKCEAKTLAIVPAYNEEGSVGGVVKEIRRAYPLANILVINDGSTDLTSEKARQSGGVVLDLPFNLGIGGAMQAGYLYAYEKGYEIAIQVDGDGQHDPGEIPKLIGALMEKKTDMVIGSRFMGKTTYQGSIMRKMGIFVLSRVISTLMGQLITDPTSGFRASNRKAIRLFAFKYPQDYPEPEVMVLFKKSGLTVCEVPVEMKPRYSGESSITKIRSVYYMVKVLLAVFVDIFKEKPSLERRMTDVD